MTYAYFNQRKTWCPKDKPPLDVIYMDPAWRANAARWLERRAAYFEMRYTFGELYAMSTPLVREVIGEINGVAVEGGGSMLSALDLMSDLVAGDMDRWRDERAADPIAWIRTTKLYRALVADVAVAG